MERSTVKADLTRVVCPKKLTGLNDDAGVPIGFLDINIRNIGANTIGCSTAAFVDSFADFDRQMYQFFHSNKEVVAVTFW